jgi:hypothetical protein
MKINKLKIDLPFDPAVLFLGIYQKKNQSQFTLEIPAYLSLSWHCSQKSSYGISWALITEQGFIICAQRSFIQP